MIASWTHSRVVRAFFPTDYFRDPFLCFYEDIPSLMSDPLFPRFYSAFVKGRVQKLCINFLRGCPNFSNDVRIVFRNPRGPGPRSTSEKAQKFCLR